MASKIRIEKTCCYCEKQFIAKTTKTKYCCHRCNQLHYKQRKRDEKIENAKKEVDVKEKDHVSYNEAIREKDFLKIKEAADLIGVSLRTFYRLMKDGTIKSYKLGGRTIIKRADIDSLFQ